MLFFLQTFKMPAAIILGPFGVVFPGLLAQIWTSLYQIFTCDTLQNNASHMSQFLRTKILKNKDNFLAYTKRLSVYTGLHPKSYTKIFSWIKVLIKIHNFGKFHQHNSCGYCGYQVENFQSFLLIQHPRNYPFWGVFGS